MAKVMEKTGIKLPVSETAPAANPAPAGDKKEKAKGR
jgi:hypothetical protein